MYKLQGINRKRTTRYHPQCNGKDENINKTLKRYNYTFVNSDIKKESQKEQQLDIGYLREIKFCKSILLISRLYDFLFFSTIFLNKDY